MTFQFCYVVTGGGQSLYTAMATVSASFLRHLYPEGRIVVVCDDETQRLIQAGDRGLRSLVDEVIGVAVNLPTPLLRSRFLKTLLRSLIKGAFVFLDADTLPIKRFDPIFGVKRGFAAVPDWDSLANRRVPERLLPKFERMGWHVGRGWYFNSGLFFLNDTPEADRLGGTWHEKWLEFKNAEEYTDQPPLHSAIQETGVVVHLLPESYNAMLIMNPPAVSRAHVLHFFSSMEGHWEQTVFRELVDEVQHQGQLDASRIKAVLDGRRFWGNMDSFYRQWYTGHYAAAARIGVRRLTRRLAGRVR